jgi:hypothetical protein
MQAQAEAQIKDLRRVKSENRRTTPKRQENRSQTKSGGKYGNKKAEVDGRIFDSQKEAAVYMELKVMQEGGLIKDLQCQVPFELVPKQVVGGKTWQPAKYVADFVYTDCLTDEVVVTDVKGYKKGAAYNMFTLKKKLMLHVHGIEVREV